MNLNSPIFIFLFLPVILVLYWLNRQQFKIYYLIFVSLLYYLWADTRNFPFIVSITIINYIIGKSLQKNNRKVIFTLSIIFNVSTLVLFKIYAQGYALDESAIKLLSFLPENMPLGYSFYSFTSIAYLIDSYKNRIKNQKDIKHYFLYQLFFTKISSGPIVRFPNLEKINPMSGSLTNTSNGLRRFIRGFIKKVLIADIMGVVVDQIFELDVSTMPLAVAWIGILFYTIQIFYDFSGYTDMALGLGMCFGISLPENFNFPYVSKSIGEFWRRWHITLSNWFRDYIFYPLEKSRKRKYSSWPQSTSVLIVFLLTGLWHGISINFIIWGLIHGIIISIENSSIGSRLKSTPAFFQHFYSLGIIIFAWIFFRSPNFSYALGLLRTMFDFTKPSLAIPVHLFQPIESFTWLMFIIGILFSTPFINNLMNIKKGDSETKFQILLMGNDFVLLALFSLGILFSFDSTYATFLYAQF